MKLAVWPLKESGVLLKQHCFIYLTTFTTRQVWQPQRWQYPLINYLTHEGEAEETEHEGEIDNTDELVRENNFDLNFEDETQGNEIWFK